MSPLRLRRGDIAFQAAAGMIAAVILLAVFGRALSLFAEASQRQDDEAHAHRILHAVLYAAESEDCVGADQAAPTPDVCDLASDEYSGHENIEVSEVRDYYVIAGRPPGDCTPDAAAVFREATVEFRADGPGDPFPVVVSGSTQHQIVDADMSWTAVPVGNPPVDSDGDGVTDPLHVDVFEAVGAQTGTGTWRDANAATRVGENAVVYSTTAAAHLFPADADGPDACYVIALPCSDVPIQGAPDVSAEWADADRRVAQWRQMKSAFVAQTEPVYRSWLADVAAGSTVEWGDYPKPPGLAVAEAQSVASWNLIDLPNVPRGPGRSCWGPRIQFSVGGGPSVTCDLVLRRANVCVTTTTPPPVPTTTTAPPAPDGQQLCRDLVAGRLAWGWTTFRQELLRNPSLIPELIANIPGFDPYDTDALDNDEHIVLNAAYCQ